MIDHFSQFDHTNFNIVYYFVQSGVVKTNGLINDLLIKCEVPIAHSVLLSTLDLDAFLLHHFHDDCPHLWFESMNYNSNDKSLKNMNLYLKEQTFLLIKS